MATAVAWLASAASAESVLERVLLLIENSIGLTPVNGTFANIAENIGGPSIVRVYESVVHGDLVSESEYQTGLAAAVRAAAATVLVPARPLRSAYPSTTAGIAAYTTDLGLYNAAIAARDAAAEAAALAYAALHVEAGVVGFGALLGIDGSITTTVQGISGATQAIVSDVVTVTEKTMPRLDFGGMATTALGAVNTGAITLGVAGSVEVARTASAQSVSSRMTRLGGQAGSGAVMLNVASNMSGINGSIINNVAGVNAAVSHLATTGLGSVNTGSITVRANTAVDSANATSVKSVSASVTQAGAEIATRAILLNIASNVTGINGSISNSMQDVNGTVGRLSTTALGAVNTGAILSGVGQAVQGIVGRSGEILASN